VLAALARCFARGRIFPHPFGLRSTRARQTDLPSPLANESTTYDFPTSCEPGPLELVTLPRPLCLPVVAQTARRADPEDDTVELSPFTVTTAKYAGYDATNTLAGTRLNTEIANTPVSLSVMTRIFSCIAANDANRHSNTGSMRPMTRQCHGKRRRLGVPFNIGCADSPAQRMRAITVRSDFLSESYNIDTSKLRAVRNSVLFGIASPGGTFNASINAPDREELNNPATRVASFNEFAAL